MGYADILITNGPIFRGLHVGFAEGLAIYGDRIIAVTSRDAVLPLAGRVPCPVELGAAPRHMPPMGFRLSQSNLHTDQMRTHDDRL